MKNGKRILSVVIAKQVDESPDTSHMGEYSDKITSRYSIDRTHSLDCPNNDPISEQGANWIHRIQSRLEESSLPEFSEAEEADAYQMLEEIVDGLICDCGGRGDMEHGEYHYFNPSFNYVDEYDKPTDGLTSEEVRKYVQQDYERMESMNRGSWCYLGIGAEAEVQAMVDGKPYSTKLRAWCWGFESDMSHSDMESVEQEQLAELRVQLEEYGFSKRAIATAFKNVEHKDE
jgi:hypothetical protein